MYEGEYRNGLMHGRGKYTFADGTVDHDGEWEGDEPVKEDEWHDDEGQEEEEEEEAPGEEAVVAPVQAPAPAEEAATPAVEAPPIGSPYGSPSPERALELAVYNHNRRLMHEDIGVIRLQRYG